MNIYDHEFQPFPDRILWEVKSFQDFSIGQSLHKIDSNLNIMFINYANWDASESLINVAAINRSEIDLVIYLMCDHLFFRHSAFDRDIDNLKKISKPVVIVGSYLMSDIDFPQIVYSAFWFTSTIQLYQKTTVDFRTTDNTKKTYMYSSLSHRLAVPRIVNFYKFKESTYYNKSLVTLHQDISRQFDNQILSGLEKFSLLDKYYNEILPMLPVDTGITPVSLDFENDDFFYYFSHLNPAYLDSYVNVICEHSYPDFYISEKTVKPLIAKQFFVVVASRGFISKLRDLGFDTYDDIIDHDVYDDADDLNRIDQVHKLLDIMQHYDWEKIYLETEHRRELNRQKVLSLEFEQQFILEISKFLEPTDSKIK